MGDLSDTLRSVQRAIVIAAVPVIGCLVWTSAAESFQLPKMTLLAIGAVALLALGASVAIWQRRIELPGGIATWFALVFAAAAVLATVTSSLPRTSLVGEYGNSQGLLSYGSYVVLFLVAGTVLRGRDLTWLLRSCLVGVVFVGLFGVAQAAGLEPIGRAANSVKVFTTLGNSNFTAGWVAALLPVTLWAALDVRNPQGWRIAGVVGAVAAAITIVATRSFQGPLVAIVGLGAFFAILTVAGRGREAITRRHLAIGGGLLVVAIALLLVPFVRDEISEGLLERRFMWRAALRVIADNPLLGSGLDTYANQFFGERAAEHGALFGLVNPLAPHDVPLSLGAGGGLLLMGPYLGFVLAVGTAAVAAIRRSAVQDRTLVAALVASWLGYQVQSLVSLDTPALGTLHWVLAGAVVVASGAGIRARQLPGEAPARNRKGGRRGSAPIGTKVGIAVVAVAALLAVVPLTQALRADLVFRDAAKTDDVGAARERLERARDLAPWEGVYALAQSSLEENFGSPIVALELAEEAAELDPGDPGPPRRAALLAEKLQRMDVAGHWWEMATARDPRNPMLLSERAGFAGRAGDHAEAVELVEEALDVGEGDLTPEQITGLQQQLDAARAAAA